MSERFHHISQPLEETPLELVDDIFRVSAELQSGIADMAGAETAMLRHELQPGDDAHGSLQEKYQTAYNPERTITGIGKFGLLLANPSMFEDRLTQDAVTKIEQDRDPSYLRAA